MNKLKTTLGATLLLFAGSTLANHGSAPQAHGPAHGGFEYGRVVNVQPIYRQVEVSTPVQECYEVPVYHTQRRHKSAGGMLAGGLIGGIIGHQFGKGDGRRVATADEGVRHDT